KTSLAIHLAYRLRSHFPDGILWARLDSTDTMSVLSSFARAYGLDVHDYKDVESCSRAVRELLAYKRTLIVLDNAETSEQVQPLLPPSGTCAVIITTRRRDLAVTRGAHRLEIGPFERREDSFNLFAEVLGSDHSQREQEPLMNIADLLGHLPLALDIAASRMAHEPGWSVNDFLGRLRDEKTRLGQLVYENQSVRLSFNISYEMLSAEQQDVFHALGLFGGEDFSLEAAAHVATLGKEVAADHLRSLYALSLVQLGRPDRYRLHPLLRDMALEKTRDDTLQRMASFFVEYAESHQGDHAALDIEITNILAALEMAFQKGMDSFLLRGASALVGYLETRGLYDQIELHLNRAIHSAETLGDNRAQAFLRCKLGEALIRQGKPAAAQQCLQEGLDLTRSLEASDGIAALTLGHLGFIAYIRNDYTQMEQYFLQALPLARLANEVETGCRLLEGLSETAQRRGDYAAAEAYCREGVGLARQLENSELISVLLKGLANVIFERGGDYAEVSFCLQESLAAAREAGHRRSICLSLLSLGYITCEHGDYERAEGYLHDALASMHEEDFPVERTFVLCTLGLVMQGRRLYTRSAAYLREALALARQVGIDVLIASIQNAWGWLYIEQGNWDAATEAFSDALSIARQTGDHVQVAGALHGLARVAATQGDLEAAHRNGKEALGILETIGHRKRADVQAWLATLDLCQ
ncbi:MAG: ATP-binding protein, partial [Chloroflexota bacterium]